MNQDFYPILILVKLILCSVRGTDLNKFYNYLLIWLVSIGPVNALELGQIQVNSYLNEPFNANFTLGHIEADNLADIILSVGGQEDYQSIGLTRSQFLNNIKFEIIPGKENRHQVNLSTRQLVREPILDILLKVTAKQGMIKRLYTLMLDPRAHETAIPVSDAATEVTAASQGSLAINRKKIAINQPAEKQLVENDSISMIAQNSALHEKYSVYQIMRAYYLLNRHAFLRGNINFLKAGVTLIVPDEELIAEKTRQQSINFVYRVSTNEVTDKKSSDQQINPAAEQSQKVAETTLVAVEQPELDKKESQDKVSSPQLELNKIQNNLNNDVKVWRNVSQEFASLSAAVSSQNDALQRQSSVLYQIDNRLELNNQQLQEFHLRLAALENSNSRVQGNADNGEAVTGSTEVSQQKNFEQSLTQSIERSTALGSIRKRLADLEEQRRIATAANAGKNTEIPHSPSGKPQQNNVAIQPYSLSNMLTWGIALMVIFLLLNREFVWRRRLKALELLPVTKPNDEKPEQEYTESAALVDEAADPVDADKVEDIVEQQVSSDKEVIQDEVVAADSEDLSVSNLELAEDQYNQAISEVQDYQKKFSEVLEFPFEENKDSQTLYTEIDILIAYQLYDEALELVEKSRENLKDNHSLDIRELQILGYLKDSNRFVSRYEQQKDILSLEFPEEWKKIEQFNQELSAIPHLTAAK